MRYKFADGSLYFSVFSIYLVFEVLSNYTVASLFFGGVIVYAALGFIFFILLYSWYDDYRHTVLDKLIKKRILINTSLLLVSLLLSDFYYNTNFLISITVKFIIFLVLINTYLSYLFGKGVDELSSPIYHIYNIALINMLGKVFKDANTKGNENMYLTELSSKVESLKSKIFTGKKYALSSGELKTLELIYTLLSTSVIYQLLGPLI